MVRKDVQGKPGWLVSVPATGTEKKEAMSRAFGADKDALMFQWLASTPPANHLRNCILDIQAGGKRRIARTENLGKTRPCSDRSAARNAERAGGPLASRSQCVAIRGHRIGTGGAKASKGQRQGCQGKMGS